MAARPLHSLPALVLAWTLALLITPALATACNGATTNTFTGAPGGDWTTAANWTASNGVTHAVPISTDHVCIPGSTAVVVNGGAGAAGIEVEGGLTVNSSLSIGSDPSSRIAGAVQVAGGGSLALAGNTLYDSGTLTVAGTLVITGDFQIDNGLDVAGTGTIDNSGSLRVTTSTGANHTIFSPALNNNGLVTNDGPVDVAGGGSGNGNWKLGSGSGADEPVVTISTTQFSMNGDFTDVESGGLGHLVLDTKLTMVNTLAQDPHIHVYRLDATSGATLDFSPIPTGTSSVSVANLDINSPGNLFEVNAPLTVAQLMTMRDGALLVNDVANVNTFHWGGGGIESSNGSTVVVQGLDMSTDNIAGDTGDRTELGSVTVAMAGAAYGTPTYSGPGSLTLGGTSVFKIDAGAQFSIGDDSDIIAGSAFSRVINNGIISKVGGTPTTGSHIQPPLTTSNGELWVNSGLALILDAQPDTFDSGTNTLSGSYILDGELVIPATINRFAGQWQLGAGGTITQTLGGTDIFSTLNTNEAGSTITVFNPISIANNFVNSGVVDVKAGGTFTVAAGKTYTQTDPAAVTKLSDPSSQLTAVGGVSIDAGTLQGVGTILGSVTNSGGTVGPGNSPGTLTIDGDFTQSGTGIFREEIDGPAAGQFDQLVVIGTATLGGTLVVTSTNGYQAPDGVPFQIVNAAALTGTWGSIVQSPTAPYFDPVYRPNTMVLLSNSVSVGDATVNEGNSGTTDTSFTISLAQAAPAAVSVDWATQDGSATAGSDYTGSGGTVTFAPGETTKTVTIAVNGDAAIEPTENFAVNLSNPVGTRVRDANAVGTITNDDSPQATAAQVSPDDIDGFLIPPPPVQGKAVNVEPVTGTVLVKLPGKTKFIPLPDAEQVPVGTIVDARKGTVRLYSAGTGGRVQSAIFYQGIFQVLQKQGQALTQAKLVGGSFAGCPKTARASAAAKRKKSSSVRQLWGSGSGQFRTAGRYASATIRGTKWLTDDRCDGTLIRVTVGAVTVRDLVRKTQLVLKKPKSYLARAKRR